MRLLPFDEVHAATVAGWPASPREVEMWCARKEFPLPPRVVTGWQGEQDVRSHLLFDGLSDGPSEGLSGGLSSRLSGGAGPIGYGELWLDPEENEVELARIIVAPGARGRGVGRELVRALTRQARDTGMADVFMRVHPGNDRALRCYRGAGFLPVDPALAATWNVPQPIDYVWLRHAEPEEPVEPGEPGGSAGPAEPGPPPS
ncbi:GNAT family N-acetyltransferase [Streptosporangium sp. NPDC023615]|uniref:GNAT family N-acetyltransferase n=1 Tax=Streptosporangium sp. NPDC023615 TaxID=3154794 RepID=UPI003440D4DD